MTTQNMVGLNAFNCCEFSLRNWLLFLRHLLTWSHRCTYYLHVRWLYPYFLITFPHRPLWHRQSSFHHILHVRICSIAWQPFLAAVWLCCPRCLNACFSLLCPSHASTRKTQTRSRPAYGGCNNPCSYSLHICFCLQCLP